MAGDTATATERVSFPRSEPGRQVAHHREEWSGSHGGWLWLGHSSTRAHQWHQYVSATRSPLKTGQINEHALCNGHLLRQATRVYLCVTCTRTHKHLYGGH